MREIKFRAWHKIQHKMYSAEEMGEGQLTLMPDGRGFANISSKSLEESQIDNGERMIALQYTGLKDKDGVEIYEGDILRVGEGIMFPTKLTVRWLGFGFKLTAPSYVNSIENSNPENLMIIGNIYENPELLESKD